MPKMLRFTPGLRLASVSINPGRNRWAQEPPRPSASKYQPSAAKPSLSTAEMGGGQPSRIRGLTRSHRSRKHTGHCEVQEQQRNTSPATPGLETELSHHPLSEQVYFIASLFSVGNQGPRPSGT